MKLPAYIDGVYRPGVTVAGQLNARLSWLEDGTVKIVTSSGTPDQPQYNEVFSVPAAELAQVNLLTNTVKFTLLDGSSHRFELMPMGPHDMRTVFGIIDTNSRYKDTDFDSWLDAFKAAGVKTSRVGVWRLVSYVAIVTVLLIIVPVVVVALNE